MLATFSLPYKSFEVLDEGMISTVKKHYINKVGARKVQEGKRNKHAHKRHTYR